MARLPRAFLSSPSDRVNLFHAQERFDFKVNGVQYR